MNNSLKEIADRIKKSDSILLTAHILPDGDSIGSVLGLGLALKSLSKKVLMVMEDPVPHLYHFLAGSSKIILPDSIKEIPELVIFLDCTDYSRAGSKWYDNFITDNVVINIDHHISNQHFASLNYVDDSAAATAQIICRLLKEMNAPCSQEIATALYTGIVMDTGSFKYQNTTPDTLREAAWLLEQGIDLSFIREKLYENKSLESLRVLALALSNLQVSSDKKIAWTSLSKQALEELQVKPEHCDGVVNYPISIMGVEVGLLFREMDNGAVKVGLRCRTGRDVNKIAGFFGGGGHKLAAGCQLDGPLEKVINQVLEATRQTLGGS
ncbi:MAG: bifunctional oligoribonuclease/PAP phosphatase NrnA [Desulfitobacteriaceae bacterium]|nr:bifunctional oligoribonuclease/PAP phosphatase NrnA [Desulfitobacteriaceae bacterium]MDD4751775.1 bifunctional oligoribonuclease/PAP phosphatase NrnA [Desulfitobacteriaceae bacterium]